MVCRGGRACGRAGGQRGTVDIGQQRPLLLSIVTSNNTLLPLLSYPAVHNKLTGPSLRCAIRSFVYILKQINQIIKQYVLQNIYQSIRIDRFFAGICKIKIIRYEILYILCTQNKGSRQSSNRRFVYLSDSIFG